jgi:hypothetical protein
MQTMAHERSERERLCSMGSEARRYLRSFKWAPEIQSQTLWFGVGDVIAVFSFTFATAIDRTKDDELWVVVGDLPAAYLVVNEGEGPRAAVATYCKLMSQWCAAVESDESTGKTFPIEAQATKENAELLRRRIEFIEQELLSQIPATRKSPLPAEAWQTSADR